MSIFPERMRQGEIKFIIAKNLPYVTRLIIISILLLLGLSLQLVMNFWIGAFALISATALSLIRGYRDKPALTGPEQWSQVTPDEYKKVKNKQNELKRWDLDLFDITNPLGGFFFAIVACICLVIWVFLEPGSTLANYWRIDCIVLLVPHWITGVRSFLRQDRLIIKINVLERMIELLSSPSDIQVLPMLATRQTKEKGTIPTDARLMVRFLNAPDYFLGLQIQISINSVQGNDYPYLYCVLIAQENARLFSRQKEILTKNYRNILLEQKNSDEVDVLVIRQQTTKTSGYHTNLSACRFIVQTTIEIARTLLALPSHR